MSEKHIKVSRVFCSSGTLCCIMSVMNDFCSMVNYHNNSRLNYPAREVESIHCIQMPSGFSRELDQRQSSGLIRKAHICPALGQLCGQ